MILGLVVLGLVNVPKGPMSDTMMMLMMMMMMMMMNDIRQTPIGGLIRTLLPPIASLLGAILFC